MNALETAVHLAWEAWGAYAGYHLCYGCNEMHYCRRSRRRWFCVGCFEEIIL